MAVRAGSLADAAEHASCQSLSQPRAPPNHHPHHTPPSALLSTRADRAMLRCCRFSTSEGLRQAARRHALQLLDKPQQARSPRRTFEPDSPSASPVLGGKKASALLRTWSQGSTEQRSAAGEAQTLDYSLPSHTAPAHAPCQR